MEAPTLVELCFKSVAEHLEYNSEAIKKLPIDLTERLITYMVDRLHPRHLAITQTHAIKIILVKQKRSCTYRFFLHGTVAQAIQQIYDKTEDGTGLGVECFGLFQPAGAFRKARWLQEKKPLSYYDIDPSDVLEFKSKETTIKINFLGPWEQVVHPLHVSTLDKTVKTFIVDESKPVSEIAKDIARKLGLKCAEEFSLKRQQNEGEDVGIWLVPDLTLPEQVIDPLQTTFLLKREFYFSDEKISTTIDPATLHYFYCQCLDAITAMTHPCTLDEAVLFAALQCQICFGDFNPQNTALHSFRLKEFLPLEYISYKNIEREIMINYHKLLGMTEEKAKFGYIQLTKSLKSYLYTFFRVERFMNKNHTITCLLGISADTVLILDAETKETIDRHPFTQIKKWQVLHSFFSIYLPDQKDKEEYLTEEAETISQVLHTYIHHSLRDTPAIQKRFDNDYDSISRVYSRRRLSLVDLDLTEHDNSVEVEMMEMRRCALYVEPKKMFINPLYGPLATTFPNKCEDIVKINKFAKILRMLSELSSKMIRSLKGNASKEREIFIRFSDKKVKSFVVNETRTVRELAMEIGRRLGIKNTEEFSLQIQHNMNQLSNQPQGQPLIDDDMSLVSTELSSSSWLIPNQTLAEQEVPDDAVLLYKKKFYYNDASDDCNNDPVYFNLLFCQSRDAIISNVYACSKEEALQLAATLFQINFGDHNPNIHKPGFLKPQDLRFFLPVEYLEEWNLTFQKVEKMIYKEHRKLRGIKEVYAKFRYVQLCRTLKTFGAVFFQVKPSGRPHPLLPLSTPPSMLLGFSRKCIFIVASKTKKFLLEAPLAHLRRWRYSKITNLFTLDFGDYREGCFTFYTTEGDAICQYLSDYIDFIQTKMVGSQALTTVAES